MSDPVATSFLDIVPATAEEGAYRYILHRIRMGIYLPGMRLLPEDIAADIHTSRMPVREAFRRLATEGLLTIRPNRGAVVRGLSAAEMREVFDMRAVLEGLAVTKALERIGSKELARLEGLIDSMESDKSNIPQWITAHREFHEYLCRLSNSPRLVAQISSLHSIVEPHMRTWLELVSKPISSRDEHMAILISIRMGDAAAVEATLRAHIRSTVPALLRTMQDGNG
jgi:DNA-binding GntR family transcriptional regulator